MIENCNFHACRNENNWEMISLRNSTKYFSTKSLKLLHIPEINSRELIGWGEISNLCCNDFDWLQFITVSGSISVMLSTKWSTIAISEARKSIFAHQCRDCYEIYRLAKQTLKFRVNIWIHEYFIISGPRFNAWFTDTSVITLKINFYEQHKNSLVPRPWGTGRVLIKQNLQANLLFKFYLHKKTVFRPNELQLECSRKIIAEASTVSDHTVQRYRLIVQELCRRFVLRSEVSETLRRAVRLQQVSHVLVLHLHHHNLEFGCLYGRKRVDKCKNQANN